MSGTPGPPPKAKVGAPGPPPAKAAPVQQLSPAALEYMNSVAGANATGYEQQQQQVKAKGGKAKTGAPKSVSKASRRHDVERLGLLFGDPLSCKPMHASARG